MNPYSSSAILELGRLHIQPPSLQKTQSDRLRDKNNLIAWNDDILAESLFG